MDNVIDCMINKTNEYIKVDNDNAMHNMVHIEENNQ